MPSGFILDPGNPTNPQPVKRVDFRIQWTVSQSLNDVVGFNVCLTSPTGSPLNATSVKKAFFVQNPAALDYVFTEVPAGDYVGWVQAVAVGGDSKWMASTTVTVVDDGVPTIRGADDRNIQAFCEDYRSASLPTGITVTDAAYNLTALAGSLRLSANSASDAARTDWDVEAWIDAYLAPESKKDGNPVILVRCKYDAAINAAVTDGTIQMKAANGSTYQTTFPLIRDGAFHDYRIQISQLITLTGANSATVRFDTGVDTTTSGGGYVWVDAIALGFDNFDMGLDGQVDKGITSWNQFDSDPTGGGWFLTSPVRPAGSGSSQLVMDENGVFWLRDESGNLVTEHGYKLGRVGVTTGAASGTEVPWGDATYLDPVIPLPEVVNKLRLAFERRGGAIWQTPTYSPVRVYLEASHLQTTGFRVQHLNLEGIADGSIAQLQKDLTTIAAAKGHDNITLNETDSFASTTTNFNDAFWINKDDAAEPFTSSFYSFRQVGWIHVVMPTSKKADGSYYYCDLKFIVKYGDVIAGGTDSYTLGSEVETLSSVVFRCYADGRTWRIPIVIGKANPPFIAGGTAAIDYTRQGIAVRYRLRTLESGAPAGAYPTTVSMPRCDIDYYANASTQTRLYGQKNLNYLYLQEY